MPQALPVITGVVGLVSQMNAQKSAQSAADQALSLQEQQAQREAKLFDELQTNYDNQVAEGVFNPSGNVEQFRDAYKQSSDIAAKNLASAAAVAGYRPGDTLPAQELAGQQTAGALQEAQGEMSIRQAAEQNQNNALQALTGQQAGIAQNVGNTYGNINANEQNQANAYDPTGLLQSLGALFNKPNPAIANSTNIPTGSGGSGGLLGIPTKLNLPDNYFSPSLYSLASAYQP